ncbi:MAG: hypothetical protein ACE5FC_11735, partial [Myxococcota bacterium]
MGFLAAVARLAPAVPARADRVSNLEAKVDALTTDLKAVRKELADERSARRDLETDNSLRLDSLEEADLENQGAVGGLQSLFTESNRVKVGGYGSVRFENGSSRNPSTFTFRRFVLTTDAQVNDRLSVYSEIEYERFSEIELEKDAFKINEQDSKGRITQGLGFKQEIEGTDGSEIAIEQAWAKYKIFGEKLALQAGAVLVPIGRFNQNHDDNLYEIPRRPLVVKGAPVIPVNAAWTELGVGFLGTLVLRGDQKLSYWAYVLNGVDLDAVLENEVLFRERTPGGTGPVTRRDKLELEVELRNASGSFNKDGNNDKAYAARVLWSPNLNLDLGFSVYGGRYTDLISGSDQNIKTYAGDLAFRKGPFEIIAEGYFTSFGDTAKVFRGLARRVRTGEAESADTVVETEIEIKPSGFSGDRFGYYVDVKYFFWPDFLNGTFLATDFENPRLVLVGRAETVVWRKFVKEVLIDQGVHIEDEDRIQDRYTIALAYRPVPDWVISLAWEYTFA